MWAVGSTMAEVKETLLPLGPYYVLARAVVQRKKRHINIYKFGGLSGTGWVAKLCLCVSWGPSLWWRKHINKIPRKIWDTIVKLLFICFLFVCFVCSQFRVHTKGSCNNTLLRRVLRRFSNSKCFLEGSQQAPVKIFSKTRFLEGFLEGSVS